jgi:hypothetical protein
MSACLRGSKKCVREVSGAARDDVKRLFHGGGAWASLEAEAGKVMLEIPGILNVFGVEEGGVDE